MLANQTDALRIAIERAPTGMLMVDRQGRIVMVNAEIERLFGYAREELIGEAVEILLPLRARSAHVAMRVGFLQALEARPMGKGRDLRFVGTAADPNAHRAAGRPPRGRARAEDGLPPHVP